MAGLILGPMARWASTSEATVWVETDEPCEVVVRPETGEAASARTLSDGDLSRLTTPAG